MDPELASIDRSGLIGTTSTLIAAPNARRVWISGVNQGANDVWVCKGRAAVADTGTYLVAGGGSFLWDKQSPWKGSVYAIADAVASIVTCEEVEELN